MTAPPTNRIAAGAGLSGHLDLETASAQACEQAAVGLPGGAAVDLALLFVSGQHAPRAGSVAGEVQRRLAPGTLVGVTTHGVIGGATELEGQAGVSVLALSLPGVTLRSFTHESLPRLADNEAGEGLEALGAAVGADPRTRAIVLFGEPSSFPVVRLLPALSRLHECAGDARCAAVLGGMAGAREGNMLLLDERVLLSGGVGVTISGAVDIGGVVSQGCRPVGEPMVITGAKRNVIFTLSGRPALEAVTHTVQGLDIEERMMLRQGLFLGRVINEYKDRFGRGDFLIRSVLGADDSNGAIAVGDFVRVGQTVQLHVRDAETAREDLALLMDGQRLHGPPEAAMLVLCNGRGAGLFGRPNQDAALVHEALTPEGGQGPGTAIAGFFAAGEFGPIGGRSFLHGHTACVTTFRAPAPDAGQSP